MRTRLGDVDLTVEQGKHVEALGYVLDLIANPGLLHCGRQLVFVAKAPVAHLLAGKVVNRGDSLIGKADHEGSRPLEHLGDVHDVCPLLA